MLRFRLSQFGWLLVLMLGLLAVIAQAQEYRYRYVALDEAQLPEGFSFFDLVAINNRGWVYVVAYDDDGVYYLPHVAVYKDGAVDVTVDQLGVVYAVNQGGIIGGSVLLDLEDYIEQAALFHGDQVELIPPQPGEFTSFVTALNDSGMALVVSYDASGQRTYVLYKNGRTTVLDFGPSVRNPSRRLAINNQGIIAGTQGISSFNSATGFRFDPRTGETTLLYPLSPEPLAWGLNINNRGDVLGYSFVSGRIERIGVWDRKGTFKTYFVEGVPEFPTISNSLLFNDNNLIVITFVSNPPSERFNNSYLVPKPGVRLNLADLVENLPVGRKLSWIKSLNNQGDMIGSDFLNGASFLLERIGKGG